MDLTDNIDIYLLFKKTYLCNKKTTTNIHLEIYFNALRYNVGSNIMRVVHGSNSNYYQSLHYSNSFQTYVLFHDFIIIHWWLHQFHCLIAQLYFISKHVCWLSHRCWQRTACRVARASVRCCGSCASRPTEPCTDPPGKLWSPRYSRAAVTYNRHIVSILCG